MKKIVIAASLLAAFGAAQADLKLVDGTGTGKEIMDFGVGDLIRGIAPQTYGIVGGTITSLVSGPIALTYLGKEAVDLNDFLFSEDVVFTNTDTPPKTEVKDELAGDLLFQFKGDNSPITAMFAVFGKMEGEKFVPFTGGESGYTFDYVLGFNDGGSTDGDYDDIVIGITAVPEPSTYALMAAGLGAIGFVARRRQRKA